jgi:hypothetical protein
MRQWQKLAACVAAGAIAAGGWVWAAAGASSPTAHLPARANAAAPAAAVDTAVESKYTPITPCRIIDTRNAGGKLAAGGTRSFVATGTTGFTTQGGTSAGCGIPSAASAIQVAVTAVTATGNGLLRIYPANTGVPNAAFLNYTKAFNVSSAGSITLARTGSYDFKVTNVGYTTHAVVDVQGYYVKPMWARMNYGGTLVSASRVTGIQQLVPGEVWVTFDRDVVNCAITVSGMYSGTVANAYPNGGGVVDVITRDLASNTVVDRPSYLTVTC